jgi:NADPH:quinone reductase-like Zn-dependent oxidoreductase
MDVMNSIKTMRAAVFHEHGGPEVIAIEDRPLPEPCAGQVRLRVRASALNHLDLWVRRGLPIETTMPHIGGSDIAGVIDAVGPGVDQGDGASALIGTRVVVDPSLDYDWYDRAGRGPSFDDPALRLIGEHTDGGFAEFVVVPAENLLEIPEHVSFEAAAAASLAAVTAWRALFTQGAVTPGASVLITGASGGVSTLAVQMARHAGARVFAITSGAENVERVRSLGAHHVYDRTSDDWARALKRDTQGQGVDVAIDSVGEALFEGLVRSLALRGRLVCYGATTGPRGAVDLRHVFWKQLELKGSTMGTPAEYRSAMRLVFEGAVAAPIHAVLPLDQARQAHEMLEAGGVFGKLVLAP